MYYFYLGFIIILLSIIFTYLYIKEKIGNREFFKSYSNIKLGMNNKHLEFAYELCLKDTSSDCKTFVNYYQKLRKIYNKLKKKHCKLYPDLCKKIEIK
jgi:hypothetical protein